MKNLPIKLETYAFFDREKINGKTVRNRCGRDFLFFALAYYFPDKFGSGKITAYDLEHKGYFGISMPASLAFTMIQFSRMPKFLNKLGLRLAINNREINSFFSFIKAIIFSRLSYEQGMQEIEKIIDKGEVAGVDIGVMFGGLLNHVIFIYGYDADNLYVFDTIRAPVGYEPLEGGNKYTLKFPKTEVKKRWTRFGRVWHVNK